MFGLQRGAVRGPGARAPPTTRSPGSRNAAGERHRPARGDPLRAVSDALPAGLPIARPYPVYRGHGAARERAWGAVVDTPVEPGDVVRGKPWQSDPMPVGAISSDFR